MNAWGAAWEPTLKHPSRHLSSSSRDRIPPLGRKSQGTSWPLTLFYQVPPVAAWHPGPG